MEHHPQKYSCTQYSTVCGAGRRPVSVSRARRGHGTHLAERHDDGREADGGRGGRAAHVCEVDVAYLRAHASCRGARGTDAARTLSAVSTRLSSAGAASAAGGRGGRRRAPWALVNPSLRSSARVPYTCNGEARGPRGSGGTHMVYLLVQRVRRPEPVQVAALHGPRPGGGAVPCVRQRCVWGARGGRATYRMRQ